MPDEIVTVPQYGDGRRFEPCEICQSGGFPADLVLDEPGEPPHFVCLDCALTAFTHKGRFDLAHAMENGRRDIVFLRHDPKSPSYRGGR